MDNGYEMTFARVGNSYGVVGRAGLEVAVQTGSLDSFAGQLSDGAVQAGELEISVGARSANIPLDVGNNWNLLGGGFSLGGGVYYGLNLVGGVWAGTPGKPAPASLQRCASMAVGLAPTC